MNKESGAEKIIILIVMLIVALPLAMWRGFVITKMWLWFVVPTFGVNPIPVIAAMGLRLLIGFLVAQKPADDDKSSAEILGRQLTVGLIVPAFALLWGWAFSFFM